jgi:hypothetical protein
VIGNCSCVSVKPITVWERSDEPDCLVVWWVYCRVMEWSFHLLPCRGKERSIAGPEALSRWGMTMQAGAYRPAAWSERSAQE